MRNRLEWRLAVVLGALLLLGSAALLAGCGATEAAPTEPAGTDAAPEPVASPTTAAPETEEAPAETAVPVTPGTPAGTLADSGEEVYAAECAECHGELGEGLVGPALIGDRASLGTYGTAEGLYNYVHTTMPQDAPGSLTDQQYLEVVAFLLVQNGIVQRNNEISETTLSEIPLE